MMQSSVEAEKDQVLMQKLIDLGQVTDRNSVESVPVVEEQKVLINDEIIVGLNQNIKDHDSIHEEDE